MRGRYSHVAAVMEGKVLLVAGGYNGIANGDLVAYKVPLFVSSDQGDRVSERVNETIEVEVISLEKPIRENEIVVLNNCSYDNSIVVNLCVFVLFY